MKKELKRQIKQDELVSWFQRVLAWTQAHEREVKVTGAVAIGVALLAVGWGYYSGHREDAALEAYSAALATFHAPAREELAGGEQPGGTVHATAEERWRKARDEFDAVARRYGSLETGRRAAYYAALARVELGELAEAEKTLADLATRRDGDLVPALARLALAELHRRADRLDKAADAFRQMADDPSFALPRDHALMHLGSVLEQAERHEDAAASYRRLAEEFPASVYAAEARRRAEYLGPARG